MTTPEKPYGVKVYPLRVLVDPTVLPREGFEINRWAGLGLTAEEVGFIAISVAGALVTGEYQKAIYTYAIFRMAAAGSVCLIQKSTSRL